MPVYIGSTIQSMIQILKAAKKEALIDEWHQVDFPHYGEKVEWEEKPFRFKAVENGTLIGTIDGKYESGVIYIGALIIAKDARNRGIGTLLINKAEEFGKKFKAHRTWLLTGKQWSENVFYKKIGFKLLGELPDFYFHTNFVIYSREIKY
jgi:GNAT superfamily N-acetyltransferase